MSRRSATTLTISIRVPVPAGYKPQVTVDLIRKTIRELAAFTAIKEQVIVSVSKRETIYL